MAKGQHIGCIEEDYQGVIPNFILFTLFERESKFIIGKVMYKV